LVAAASQDPDVFMAQAALIDLVSHPSCTDELYSEALRIFRGFPSKGFEEARLTQAYRERIPSWRQ
jgi:hypothetical protein